MACCILMGLALAAIVAVLKAGLKLMSINHNFDVVDQLDWIPELPAKTQGIAKP